MAPQGLQVSSEVKAQHLYHAGVQTHVSFLSGLGFRSWGAKNGGQCEIEEGDSVDKLWIKDDFLDIHTSSVHPPHTHSCSPPFSLSLLLPSVESSLPSLSGRRLHHPTAPAQVFPGTEKSKTAHWNIFP